MPKSRLSYAQAQARGSEQVNKGRFADRKDAPPTTGSIGEAPKHLKVGERKVWDEIASAIPHGVAGESDRISVEMASRLLYQFRKDAEMQASRIALLMNLMSRLGLDPQARTKLHVQQKPEATQADPATEFMNATNGHTSHIQ